MNFVYEILSLKGRCEPSTITESNPWQDKKNGKYICLVNYCFNAKSIGTCIHQNRKLTYQLKNFHQFSLGISMIKMNSDWNLLAWQQFILERFYSLNYQLEKWNKKINWNVRYDNTKHTYTGHLDLENRRCTDATATQLKKLISQSDNLFVCTFQIKET